MIGDATLTRLVRGKEIVLNARRQGGDCLLSVTGGDAPHIGAAALCADGEIRRLDRNGHREGELAAELAERAASKLGCCVCAEEFGCDELSCVHGSTQRRRDYFVGDNAVGL